MAISRCQSLAYRQKYLASRLVRVTGPTSHLGGCAPSVLGRSLRAPIPSTTCGLKLYLFKIVLINMQDEAPLMFTSYNIGEARRDLNRIRTESCIDLKVDVEREENPFRSLRPIR